MVAQIHEVIDTDTDIKLEQKINRYEELRARRDAIEEEMSQLEDDFRETLESGTTTYADNGYVRISPYTRLDKELALSKMSDRSIARVTVTTIDTRRLKKLFPRIYRTSLNHYNDRVTIKCTDDES